MNLGIIVQAHFENWGGGKSYCLSMVDNVPIILWVLRKIRTNYRHLKIVVAVPDVVENRLFRQYADEVGATIYYGSITNVLERFIGAAKENRIDAFIRIIGEHYFIDMQFVDQLKQLFEIGIYDCVIPPFDFDPKFGCDIVSIKCLEKLHAMLESDYSDSKGNIVANPIHYIASHPELFKIGIESKIPHYTESEMLRFRSIASQIYLEAYVHNPQKSHIEGDSLRTHYTLAKKYIPKDALVLDIACGDGWGSLILAETGAKII